MSSVKEKYHQVNTENQKLKDVINIYKDRLLTIATVSQEEYVRRIALQELEETE